MVILLCYHVLKIVPLSTPFVDISISFIIRFR